MNSRQHFTRAERALVARLNTPAKVQRWLNALPYNTETGGETQHSFRPVVKLRTAHCMEAALFAAVVLEQHGFPPLVMSLESQDWLDHVIFIYQVNGRWGSVARSRDPGLHGRKPVFRTPRAGAQLHRTVRGLHRAREGIWRRQSRDGDGTLRLAVHREQRVEGRADVGRSAAPEAEELDASLSPAAQEIYRAYRKVNNDRKPIYYRGREKWEPLPREFS